MKKILSLLLAMAMLLSLCPTFTMAAEAATNDVKLFDAHITGNVVVGGTLTANIKPSDSDAASVCGFNLENTLKTVNWYLRNRNGSSAGNKSLTATGATYTIPDDWKSLSIVTGAPNPSIYFTVTPMDDNNQKIGNTVYYSAVTYSPESINSEAADVPVAYNATIIPQNVEGSINVGDTVAARFSFLYAKDKNVSNGSSKYTWYTSDTMLANADIETNATEVVQEESTNPYYTIKPADAGKWIYVKIVPVSSTGSVGTAIYTKNHLGNAFLDSEVIAKGTTTPVAFRTSVYPSILLLADGTSRTAANDASTYMYTSSNTIGTQRSFVIDAGKNVSFDGLHFKHTLTKIKNLVIAYSSNNVDWTNVKSDSSELTGNQYDLDCGGVKTARYFKVEFTNTEKKYAVVDEFYPFLKTTTTVEFTKPSFAQLNGNEIEVQAWGTPLAEVKNHVNGYNVKSDLDTEGSTTNADAIASNTKFVSKNGDDYTEITNIKNIVVNENLQNTYLKVDDGKVAQYYLIKYAGNIVDTEDEVITSAAGQMAATLKFVGSPELNDDGAGNAAGKYLFKTQIKIPKLSETSGSKGIRTTINAYQGSSEINGILVLNGWYTSTNWGDSSWLAREIGIPTGGIHTGYFFRLDKWLNLEMLFDFDSADPVNGTINVTTWIDGILVAQDVHPWTDPKTKENGNATVLSPTLQLYPNNTTDMVYYKNSSFRQVWDATTHEVVNNYSINLANAEDALQAPVTTLTAGKYTLASNQNVYKEGLGNYVAKYYISADGSKELEDVVAVVNAEDFVTVTEEELAEKTVEVKGFSFHGQITPNYQAVSVNE